jgi:hypothetical protein
LNPPNDNFTYGVVPCTGATATAAPPSPSPSGTTIVITATATGCSNPNFEFWIMPPGGSWTIVQAYSTTPTYNWNTVGATAGTYYYSVWVRDASSSASYDAFFPGTAYTLTFVACTAPTATAAPASPQPSGTTITITATAATCPNARFEFWLQAPGGSWTIAQLYSSSNTFSWNTIGAVAGPWHYSVWVRDAASPNSYDAFVPGTLYTLTTVACTSPSATAAPASPQGSGTTITITATSSTCPHPLYQFWIKAPGGSWAIVQTYSTTTTFSWNTIGLVAGAYYWSVWVKDSGSPSSYDVFVPGTLYTLTTVACASPAATATPASPQGSGTTITITATSTTCPHPMYQFWTKATGGSWTIAKAYSTSATFSWNTTGLPAGTYYWSVWVRDSGSAGICNSMGCYDQFVSGTPYVLSTTACTSPSATVAPASPQPAGTTITITATSATCTHPMYQFWIKAPGGSWTIMQAYSTMTTFSWNTTGLPAGTYDWSVWVKDSGSPNSYDVFVPGTAYTLT